MPDLTPFQTVGPFSSLGLRAATGPLHASGPGAPILIRGRLLDGEHRGIPDAVLEWWHPALPALQRSLTQDDGSFSLESSKPLVVPAQDGRQAQAPHFAIRVLGRGILTQYVTRLYFADEPDTAHDPILSLVPGHRRHTLIAQAASPGEYCFDVTVQGENETVFFDF